MTSHSPISRSYSTSDRLPAGADSYDPAEAEGYAVVRRLAGRLIPLVLSVLMIASITAVLWAVDSDVATMLVPVAYLIPVIFAATRWGMWPAILASVAAMAAADFFFLAPIFSFRVDDPQEAVDLLLFLIVSLVSSNLASKLRNETETLRRREREMQALYEFSRRLAACFTIAELISAIQEHLARAFGQPVAFFVATSSGHFEPSEAGFAPPEVQASAAAMNSGNGPLARTIIDGRRDELWLLRTISSESTVHGVIAVNIGRKSQRRVASRTRRVDTILYETSLTLQRLDLGKAMETARLHLQAQMLRDAFHGTLSHELCSPLATIKGSASVLETVTAVREDPRMRSLVEAISEESSLLDGYIQNLLSATRVTAGGLSPRLEWADPRDLVNGAVERRARRLARHIVETDFAEELPLLNVDSGLVEEALAQILENAAKYSPSGSTIQVQVRSESGRVVVQVVDEGVGITTDEQQQLGHRSFRSTRHQASVPGTGLGFWIASTFVHAHGGAISVQSRGTGHGTTVSISLPTSDTPAVQMIEAVHE